MPSDDLGETSISIAPAGPRKSPLAVLAVLTALTVALSACSPGQVARVVPADHSRQVNCVAPALSVSRNTLSRRSAQQACDNGDPYFPPDPAVSGFYDPGLGLGIDDPLMGMGGIGYVSPPSGSTFPGDNTATGPDGSSWFYDAASGNWYQRIGSTSTYGTRWPSPVIYLFGGVTPFGGGARHFYDDAAGIIATADPAKDKVCPGPAVSQSFPLNFNLPLGGGGSPITNIFYLFEDVSFTNNPGIAGALTLGGQTIIGWVYTTKDGKYFVQSSGADGNFLANLLQTLPVAGAINQTTTGALSPALTAQQANKVFQKYPVGGRGSGKGSYPCFTSALSV